MVKFEVSQKERESIILLYESHGILLEGNIWGAIARVARSLIGKNSDEISEFFKKSEIALGKELDDIVSSSIKYKNMTEIDDLKKKLMHYYNPSGNAENITAAQNEVKMFLNGYAKSRGKNNFQEYIDEITNVENKTKKPNSNLESDTPIKHVADFKYKDGQNIELISSYHQWYERFGSMDFDQIKKMYFRYGPNKRLGVPDELIKEVFEKHLGTILQSYAKSSPKFKNKYPRIRIVKNRTVENTQQKNPSYFNFIEFIILKTPKGRFQIITSSFSENGDYLKFFNKKTPQLPKLTLEKKFYFDYTLII